MGCKYKDKNCKMYPECKDAKEPFPLCAFVRKKVRSATVRLDLVSGKGVIIYDVEK